MSARRMGSRMALGVLLILVLGGPAPGSVGSCSEDATVADPVQFCVDRRSWSCQRREVRGELTEDERDACLAAVDAECAGTTWGSDCIPPTTRKTDACIGALSDGSRLSTPESELVECQLSTLCGGGR